MEDNKINVNNRVKKKSGSCLGWVKEVREEIVSPSATSKEPKSPMIMVQWDNGTNSWHSADILEISQ